MLQFVPPHVNNLQKAKAFDQAAADLMRYGWVQGTNGDTSPEGTGPRCAGQALRTAAIDTLTTDKITLRAFDLQEVIRSYGYRSGQELARQLHEITGLAVWPELESVANDFIRTHTQEGGYLYNTEIGGPFTSFVGWQDQAGRTAGQVVGVLIDIAYFLRKTDTTTIAKGIETAKQFETGKLAEIDDPVTAGF